MSSNASKSNEILSDDNYFMWEFNARMALARKGLQGYIAAMKPEDAARRETQEWKAADTKALVVVAKMLSPTYQSMIRDASTAYEAWETLHGFFVKQTLHNRVQLRKQLHEFTLGAREDLMKHIVCFDDLCSRLAAAHDKGTLLDAKEMLRREFEVIKKREEKNRRSRRKRSDRGVRGRGAGSRRGGRSVGGGGRGRHSNKSEFRGNCFNCNKFGHKRDNSPELKNDKSKDEFVFSATNSAQVHGGTWLLDSGASCHMTDELTHFDDYQELKAPISITVASGQQFPAKGNGSVRFSLRSGRVVKLTNVLYVPQLDRKLVSVPALTARGVLVQFDRDRATLSVDVM
ncbi:hypothetical protein PR001_g28311 [Phytophthora rubi]|uniref:Retrovirus-related Pol polyprotein from transposon TNT 1-94-like beta-barrel domain-containing protein n=1 Tax=Phytophthora rubi TaxID=129364 RepID=A0A6A3HA51_9STRA|nr:hypothetical protein PR001_g28311 [Phytophthora rubi]